jgi:beta-glucosidase/6-phospho-beta-glucosidase/beta-galactosidase
MKQDEIIEMARQVGMYGLVEGGLIEEFEAFAKLVAAKEREKLKNVAIFDRWYKELDTAVLAEREACAKLCDEQPYRAASAQKAAQAIRARSISRGEA